MIGFGKTLTHCTLIYSRFVEKPTEGSNSIYIIILTSRAKAENIRASKGIQYKKKLDESMKSS